MIRNEPAESITEKSGANRRSKPAAGSGENSVSLAGALLAVFLGLVEPALQDGKRLRIDFEENHAGA